MPDRSRKSGPTDRRGDAGREADALSAAGSAVHLADGGKVSIQAIKPNFGYLVYRITIPSGKPNLLQKPFGHVLVQARQRRSPDRRTTSSSSP